MNLSVNINVCRVCMKANSGVSLFDDGNLNEKFVFTTRLEPNIYDGMPSVICNKCQDRLRLSYCFVKLAHESEKNLKAFLAKINQDFELVTNNTSNKDKNNDNEDDDELLSSMLEEECDNKKPRKPEETTKRSVSEQKSTSATSSLLLPTTGEANTRKAPTKDEAENQKQTGSKQSKHAIEETTEIGTSETDNNLTNENVKSERTDRNSKDSDTELLEVHEDLEKDDVNLHNLSVTETQNTTAQTPEHEIQILDFTDEDSSVELEVLEENLQPNEDTRSSLDDMEASTTGNDGFLKEYQTMLQESDEYLEDSNAMPADHATSTTNDVPLYDADVVLLDADDTDLEVRNEAEMDHEEFVEGTATAQEQPAATENIEAAIDVDDKRIIKRCLVKMNTRGARGAKATPKDSTTSKSKRFFCFKCNRDFSTKTNLTRHSASHEGKRPFKCQVCNKSFSQNVTLKQHMYTHTGEKPYQCEICDRGFTQCKSLVFHMRRHTGEKPFPCEKCGALFRQKDGLKTHILKRHTIKSHNGDTELITCAICKEEFADNNSLQDHMKKHLSDYVRVDSAMSFSNRVAGSTDENNQMLYEVIDADPLVEPISESTDEIVPAAHVVDLMTTSALEPSRAKKFQCRKCFKCFSIKDNLMRHLATHDM